MKKPAGQVLSSGQTVGFRYQSGIEIHAHHFDVVLRKRNIRGEPARGVTDAAPYIGNTQSVANASLPNGGDHAAKKSPDTMTVIELLGQTLHLPVDGEQ